MVAILVLTAGLAAISPATSAQVACADRLDLAALTLSPDDSPLTAFAHLGAFDESLEAEALIMASYLGFTHSPTEMRDFLTEQGWQRKYLARLGQPSQSAPDRTTTVVTSYITEYCDRAGASQAFLVLEDESAASSAEDVGGTSTLGEQADVTRDRGYDAENRPFQSLDVSFQLGHHIAGVTLQNYSPASDDPADQHLVESLATILEQRLREPPAAGIGSSLARLDPAQAVTLDDAYYRLGGRDRPLFGETPSATTLRTTAYADADAVYQLFQTVGGETQQTVLYSLTLYRFANEPAATGWLADAPALIGANPYYGELTEIRGLPLPAEPARAFRFAPPGQPANALMLLAVDGATVTRVQLVPASALPKVPPELGWTLLSAQRECAGSGDCPFIDMPGELEEFVASPASSPVPAVAPAAGD